jgi:hypothetical protein
MEVGKTMQDWKADTDDTTYPVIIYRKKFGNS